ncbi:MAG: zinc-binding dehydrogenase [Myxococcota bacterium]
MQQVRIHAPGEVQLDDVPTPEPGPRDAVVRVQACGICGSDLGYIKIGGMAGPTPEPMPLGHEFSAVVDRVGSEVRRFPPGTRVVVNPIAASNAIGSGGGEGAYAPEVLVRNVDDGSVLFPIPEDLPFDRAALAEPLGVGMHAVERAGVSPGDQVTIFGAGPIGLMSLAVLKYRGFDDVAIVDLSPHRLGIAEKLGASLLLNPDDGDLWKRLRKLHGKAFFMDVVPTTGSHAYIEATGSEAVLQDILAQARPGAAISLVALHRQPRTLDLMSVMAKELTIAGSIAYPEDYGDMVRMLSEVDLSPAITHRFGLADYTQALDTARDPNVAGKVLIEP